MSTLVRSQEVVDRLDAIQLVEGFEVPKDFPIPVRDGVFLEKTSRLDDDVKTKSGIIIPSTTLNSSYKAILVAIGPETPSYLRPGMLVMYNSAVQAVVLIDGKEYMPCSWMEILCVLPPKTVLIDNDLDEGQKRREKSLERNAKALGHKKIA